MTGSVDSEINEQAFPVRGIKLTKHGYLQKLFQKHALSVR